MNGSKQSCNIRSTDTLNQLISQIYDAVIAPDNWPQVLRAMSDAFGGEPTSLLLYDGLNQGSCLSPHICPMPAVRPDPVWLSVFEPHCQKINPWMEQFCQLQEGVVACTSTLVEDEIFFRSEFYNHRLKQAGYRYALFAQVLKREHTLLGLAGLRKNRVSRQELELASALIPHLRKACALQIEMARHQALADAGFSVLDRFAMGVLLLDLNGRVRYTNKAANLILNEQDGLLLNEERYCEGQTPCETEKLQQLLRETLEKGTGETPNTGGTINLSRHAPKRPLYILAAPLKEVSNTLIEGLAAVLFISDPDNENIEAEIGLLQNVYGLTNAQAQLAIALCKGLSVEDYASRQLLSLNTVRNHLKQLFNKTGTHRQGDLVRILVSGPAFLAHR